MPDRLFTSNEGEWIKPSELTSQIPLKFSFSLHCIFNSSMTVELKLNWLIWREISGSSLDAKIMSRKVKGYKKEGYYKYYKEDGTINKIEKYNTH